MLSESGESAAERLVRGGTVVNAFTAELLPRTDVAMSEGRIAYVGPDAGRWTDRRAL